MTRVAIWRSACPVALFSCAVLASSATAQAPPPGVFSEVQTAVAPGVRTALEPATVRSRVVQVDTRKITAARRGREVLQLNLFDDAVVEVRIERVRPTQTGYFLSGRPRSTEDGEVRLVVNGPVMVGTVVTPQGKFTIRSAGSGRHVVRQIDPSAEPFECAVEDPPLPPPSSLPAISSVDRPLAQAPPPAPLVEAAPTEDGSEVRILVVYTPAIQARQGGPAGMRALVDLLVQSANQAFENAGIAPRLVLAHAAMVDYIAEGTGTDLRRLSNRDDGHMDQVHELRNRFSADLVHLLTDHALGAAGSAYRLTAERLSEESFAGYAVTATGSEETFTHEVGHNFGLRHDRHVDSPRYAIYPYAFGYINQAAFESDAPASTRWRTVMAYNRGCTNAGFSCRRVFRFSNPDQEYLGDALGVSAEDTSTGTDGPADARLTINNSARWVGSFRSQACTGFTVSPSTQITSRRSGELSFKVQADPGCLWQASSQADFVTISSETPSAGSGLLHVQVQANEGASERTGTLTVAGETVTVRQLATEEGVCGRTTAVMKALTNAAGHADVSQCDQVTDEQLAGITTLYLTSLGLTSLKAGDLQGLTGLERLFLASNQLSELPEGVFSDLSSLTTLGLSFNRLAELPAGLYTGLSRLETIRLNNNSLPELPAGLFAGLSSLTDLRLEYNELQGLPEGIFDDLANLEKLNLYSNDLVELPAGVLTGLSKLRELSFGHNQLVALAGDTFSGLTNLEQLNLFSNELTELPAGLFDGLTALKALDLGQGKFSTIPAGLFDDLSRLETLDFWDSRLLELPAGRFSGLSNLRVLNLYSNRLTELPAGAFTGLSGLERLLLGGNEFADVPADLVSGLSALKELALNRNNLSRLPGGIFSGLATLEKLHLGDNLVDPLPLTVTLERVGESQIKAVIPAGAPAALDLPLNLGSTGETADVAGSLSIAAGAVESSAVTVTRVAGTEGPVDVDIDPLPSLPANHSGYVFTGHDSLPLRLLGSQLDTDATLAGLTLSAAALEPAFSTDTASYTAVVAHSAAMVTVDFTTNNSGATVAFLDAGDQDPGDADPNADGRQVSLDVGENTVKVRVTAADTTTTRTYELAITRDGATSVCGRTPPVRDAILESAGVSNCFDVTAAQLAGIRGLPHFARKLTAVKAGDFTGLTALENLFLGINELRGLPEGVFDGLVALKQLSLAHNEISSLQASIFTGLSALEELNIFGNRLTTLPPGIFTGLSSLKTLRLSENQLTRLPADLFADLPALEHLTLGNNQLDLSSPGLFSNLTALKRLAIHSNQLQGLPSATFSGLANLEYLALWRNRLSSLPAGLFSGLTGLTTLNLEFNTLNPLPLTLSIEKVGTSQFKAVAPTGAPFALDVPVRVSGAGEIQGGAGTVTIPAGATESAPVSVNRVAGTSDSVTVDIGTLPGLPSGHTGYSFEPDDGLPAEILPSTAPAKDAALRSLSISPGTLDPSFSSGTVAYSVSVANGVSSLTLNVSTSNANASVEFLDADDQALTDADVAAEGFQVDLGVGENAIKVKVTSEDTTTIRTYTIAADRNSVPEITTQPSISMPENETAVATLSATDADGDEVSWWTNGGADAGQFDLTLDGVLTFASAPDYENPADLDADNEYEVVAQASDGADDAYLTLTVTVTDVDPEVSLRGADASLSNLSLSNGTLKPAFAAETTAYTAKVSAAVSTITLSPTTSASGAMVQYLDASDRELADADSNTAGRQLNLASGENTIRIRVTADDMSTVRTYTLVVTRNRLPVITTASVVSVEENQTAVATLSATDADNDDLSWSTNGGADAARFSLTAHGVLTFVTAPDYEDPADADEDNDYLVVVRADDGADPAELALTVRVTDVAEVDTAAQDASLSDLTLSGGALDTVFLPSNSFYTATVANPVTSITIAPATTRDGATVAYLDASDATLADADANTDGQQVALGVGENTVKVSVTAEDGVTTRAYTIVITRDSALGVCLRTRPVRAAIVDAVSGVDSCALLTSAHLAGITSLDLSASTVSTLQSGDFAGLTALVRLDLSNNRLTGLPADVFSGLSALQTLTLHENRLSRLPAGVFSGLTSLRTLVLTRIRLESLPAGVFSGLTSLQTLELQSNLLESLPPDIFSGLTSLRILRLYFNQLSSLPDGLFAGLPTLAELVLYGNKVDPLPLPVSLEKVADGQFRAVARTGMPFSLDVPISAGNSGTIDGGARTVTISAGATTSPTINVSRVSGTVDAVTADIGALPRPPGTHSGYVLEKDAALPLEVIPPQPAKDAALSALAVNPGSLLPVFSASGTSYAVSVENTVSSITFTATKRNANASIAWLDAHDQPLADSDSNTAGHQVDLDVGENTVKLKVTSSDRTEDRTYTVVVSRADAGGVCGRTGEIADAIVARISGVDACGDVTDTHLAAIASLQLYGSGISSLQSGDFDGLSNLTRLELGDNDIGSLPAGIFSDLGRLTTLDLSGNELESIPSGSFAQLAQLEVLHLNGNDLKSLVSDVFSANDGLEELHLQNNEFTTLPSGLFSGLTKLDELDLGFNQLSGLSENVFSGLTGLGELVLESNRLSSLHPAIFSGLSDLSLLDLSENLLTGLSSGVFSDLADLERLYLYSNRLGSLPPGVFSALTELETLFLDGNQLDTLPSGLFSGLDDLDVLRLHDNRFSSLPPGVFSGVSALGFLNLSGNPVDPLPLPVSLEKVGTNQFRAAAPTGVPNDLVLPVSVSSSGAIQGNAQNLRLVAGALESPALTVSRISGTPAAVTVDIGTLPGLPGGHSGYALETAGTLPLEILPFDNSADADLSGLTLGNGVLNPAFASGTTSYTASVANDVTSTTVTPTRSNSNAALSYLDASDQPLADADANTGGHQVNLAVGENTVRIRVTAVDTTTTKTYTIVISRAEATPHLPEISTTSPVSVAENQTTIATLQATDRNGDQIVWSTDGGADEDHFDLTSDGVLTFVAARDYEAPTDTDRDNDYEVVVSAADQTGASTLTLIVRVTDVVEVTAVCDRTPQVRDAIVSSVASVTNCANITDAHLAAITSLSIRDNQLTSIKSGDFTGLTALGRLSLSQSGLASLSPDAFSGLASLTWLELNNTSLASLPAGVFSGLGSLEDLSLAYNNLRSIPAGSFSGLTRLTHLYLNNNTQLGSLPQGIFKDLGALERLSLSHTALGSLRADTFTGMSRLEVLTLNSSGLTGLPGGVFDGLTALEALELGRNQLGSLPQGIFADLTGLESLSLGRIGLASVRADEFSGMSKLEILHLSENQLTSLPSTVFSGLSSLRTLMLYNNRLTALPRVVFSDLTALEDLRIYHNRLESLHQDTFDGLTKLEILFLWNNELTELPAGIFSDLTALEDLRISNNDLSSLPDGLFSGLTSLDIVLMDGNTVDPLAISVSLEKVGTNQFKAVAPVGAPFALDLPVSVTSGGEIAGSLDRLSVSTGKVESSSATVTRVAGTTDPVSADIGVLPALPASGHRGYALVKDDSLPLRVLESTMRDADASLTGLALSSAVLDPVFSSTTTEYTAKVVSTVGGVTVTPTKSSANATIAYLDANDQVLADAEANTEGQQVALSGGENTIKVKVTAEDTTTTRTYTIVVTRNRQPRITTTSPLSVTENTTAVATLAATDADSDGITWSKSGGADEALFDLTSDGVLSFATAPDFEHPADDGEDNAYVVTVRASDGTDTAVLTLTVNVTDVDDAALDADATLSGLSLSSGTLDPVFASGTTDYTARVTNSTSRITVTPTKSVAAATVAYLDASDQTLADADPNTAGRQVSLSVGRNTFKVRVTAPDTTTTRTYTVVVTRNSAPVITTTSPVSVEENQTAVATLAATDADSDDITWSRNGGVDASLFNLTPAGVLTFASAPDYESPADNGANNEYLVVVRASDGIETADLSLTVNVTNVAGEAGSSDATLSDLSLSWGYMIFTPGTTSYRATVGNNFSSITVTPTKGSTDATIAYLDGNDDALEDADANAEGQQVALDVGYNTIKVRVTAADMTTVRTYTIVVRRIDATGNAVPHFISPSGASPIDVDENQTAVVTLKAYDAENETLSWSVERGDDKDLFTVNANGELSFIQAPDFEAPADADRNNQYKVTVGVQDPSRSGSSRDLIVRVSDVDEGEDLTGNAMLSNLSLSSGTLSPAFFSGTTRYTALVADEHSTITVTPTKRNSKATLVYLDGSSTELADADTGTGGHQVNLNRGANTIRVKVTSEDGNATGIYSVVVTRNSPPRITTTSPISVEEHQAEVATLESTDADNHTRYWSIVGGADQARFNLTTRGELTFVTAPDYENPADSDTNNDYVVTVRVRDVLNSADLTLTVNVTDIDETQISSDATLSGLSLSSGTLDPVFAATTTSYTATVTNGTTSITVTPTKGNEDSTLQYLDDADAVLADADTRTEGHQVDLSPGENTFKVKLTAEDTKTTQTYTVVVTRNRPPKITSRAQWYIDENGTAVTTLAATDADGDELSWYKVDGVDLALFNLSSDGELTFVTAPDYEMPADDDGNNDYLLIVGVTDGVDPVSLSLTVEVGDLLESSATNEARLSRLTVNGNIAVFFDPDKARFVNLVSNAVSRVTVEWATVNSSATVSVLDASENALADADAGTDGHQVDVAVGATTIKVKVAAPDGATTRIYTLVVNRTGSVNHDSVITTQSPISVAENQTAVATLAHTHPDGHEVHWFLNSSSDASHFNLTSIGVLTFVSAPDYENPADANEDNDYELHVLASNGFLFSSKWLIVTVTDVDEQSGAPAEAAADAAFADVNGNGRIEADDAMIIYHAIESAASLGDGDEGGTPGARATLMAGLAGAPDSGDDDLRGMLRKANEWREVGVEAGGDMNGDGAIDGDDAMIMYYAFSFEDLLGDGEAGGAVRFRRSLLRDLAARPDPGDADLRALLRNAHALRARALAP